MRPILKIFVYIFAAIGFVLVAVYVAVELGLTNTPGIIDRQHDFFKDQTASSSLDMNWVQGEEWKILKAAIIKDKDAIDKGAETAGVPARLIVAPLVVEQLRLYYSERELFKQIFAPLKVLGDQSQFSWGVMGIKQDTAKQIENNLKDASSPFYLGPKYEHLLDYSTSTDPDSERFKRLTDENSRYYSYLYAALCIKEFETQWHKAGFDVSNRPEIIATLFNIGFANSHPNADPQVGGAEIDIGSSIYSFGGLAADFYYSRELLNEFTISGSDIPRN